MRGAWKPLRAFNYVFPHSRWPRKLIPAFRGSFPMHIGPFKRSSLISKTRSYLQKHPHESRMTNKVTLRSNIALLMIAMGTITAAHYILAQAPAQKPTTERVGLAAALADDEKVIGELAKRDLTTLRDYMFARDGISKEQQAAYLAVSSVKQLGDSKLTRKQQQELIQNVALGIDKVLATMNDPAELMRLNASLVVNGTGRHVNVLEYFGETPKVQAQLRPIAEAIDRVYEKAIASAQKK